MRRIVPRKVPIARVTFISKVITEAGHLCIFLPEFHCELNHIEYYWVRVKYDFRERCTGNFNHSKQLLDEVFDAYPPEMIPRFFRRAHRYTSVYTQGATRICRQEYRSHRAVTACDLTQAREEKETKGGKLKHLPRHNLWAWRRVFGVIELSEPAQFGCK